MTTLLIEQKQDRTFYHCIAFNEPLYVYGESLQDKKLVTKIEFWSKKKITNPVFKIAGQNIVVDEVKYIPLPPKKYKFQVEVDGNEMIIKLPKRLRQRYSNTMGLFLLDSIRLIMENDEMIVNFDIQDVNNKRRMVAMRTVRYPYNV